MNHSAVIRLSRQVPLNIIHVCIFPGGSDGKASACNARELGSIPGSGRPPGEGNDNSLQDSSTLAWKTPWTIAHQAPQSMEFFRQEYWSGLPFPSSGDLLDPGMEPTSPALAGGFLTTKPCRDIFKLK